MACKCKMEELISKHKISDKIDELLRATKKDVAPVVHVHKKKSGNKLLWALAIIGAVAGVAAIAFAVYRFFTPDYLEDFEDDFDDDFDDDFFDDDDDDDHDHVVKEVKVETAEKTSC